MLKQRQILIVAIVIFKEKKFFRQEAVVLRSSVERMFLKIHRETSVPESHLLQTSASHFIKKETSAQVFSCEF